MIATRLNVTNTTELRKNGINALKTALGVTGTLKFLEQKVGKLTVEEIAKCSALSVAEVEQLANLQTV